MTTYSLKYPAEMKRWLTARLPPLESASIGIRVTPRYRAGQKSPACDSDFYEIQAFYTRYSPEALDRLEEALRAVPGIYRTAQVRPCSPGKNHVTSTDWPDVLGSSRRGFHALRPQVLALISD